MIKWKRVISFGIEAYDPHGKNFMERWDLYPENYRLCLPKNLLQLMVEISVSVILLSIFARIPAHERMCQVDWPMSAREACAFLTSRNEHHLIARTEIWLLNRRCSLERIKSFLDDSVWFWFQTVSGDRTYLQYPVIELRVIPGWALRHWKVIELQVGL